MSEQHDIPAATPPASSAPPASGAAPASTPAPASAASDARALQRDDPSSWNELEKGIVAALKTVYDPEIPVDIWELGLIYAIRTEPKDGHVDVDMTLTSPMCPVAGTLPPEVQRKISSVPGVMACNVDVVWEPPWTPAMMSEGARLELNIPT